MNPRTKRSGARAGAALLAAVCASGCLRAERRPASSGEAGALAEAEVNHAMVPASGRRAPGAAGAAGEAVASSAPAPAIDPGVIQALEKMGAYLRGLQAFAVKSDTTIDELL